MWTSRWAMLYSSTNQRSARSGVSVFLTPTPRQQFLRPLGHFFATSATSIMISSLEYM